MTQGLFSCLGTKNRVYAERNKILDIVEKTMQKLSILLISCKLFNLYQDVKLNWYSLSIKHIYSTRCRSNQYIWFLFFLFPINLVQL